jgi:hypothetical protein
VLAFFDTLPAGMFDLPQGAQSSMPRLVKGEAA